VKFYSGNKIWYLISMLGIFAGFFDIKAIQ